MRESVSEREEGRERLVNVTAHVIVHYFFYSSSSDARLPASKDIYLS